MPPPRSVLWSRFPVQEDGVWTQVPRYTFDSTTFDITN